jgi:hypothetical protein
MSTNAIIDASNANIDQVSFTEAKRNKQGGLGVQFKYAGQSFEMRLPHMNFPGGPQGGEPSSGTSHSNVEDVD